MSLPPEQAHVMAELRPRLIAFALLQVQNPHQAEDLVQDALTAALENRTQFNATARFETWVYSILRHKLIDFIRQQQRDRRYFVNDSDQINVDHLFDEREHWHSYSAPDQWHNPEALHLRQDFWQVFDLCMLHLPTHTARVFALRELMELDTREICACLDISEENCWTILHRARLKLRGCLEKGWFLSNEEAS